MHIIILKGNPLSTQNIYRFHSRGGYMTKAGKEQKESYQWQTRSQYRLQPLANALKLTVQLFFGDKRIRDIDNYHKLSLDSFSGIVWNDDSQIMEMHITKAYDKENPRIELAVESL